MGNDDITAENQMSKKEKNMIDTVLEKYDFEVIDYSKVRSAYKIKTSNGNVCLKKINHGRYKPHNGSFLVEALSDKGFCNTAKYYKTKTQNKYVRYKNMLFYATEWIDGEECDLNNIEEAIICTKLLAQYHKAASGIDTTELRIRNNLKNWPKIFKDNLRDLERFERIVKNRKIKTEFDSMYCGYLDNIYHRAMISLNFLNTSDYYKLSKQAEKNKTICHDSFYYQNIIKKNNEYYIIDLDSILIDLHVNDLGKLIRRLMFKGSYEWNFEKAKILIEAYNEVNKLEKNELEVMLSLIVFPHKFWKLGKKRYVKCKNWDEKKYIHKLNRLMRYNEMQNKFLEEYLNYLENYQ
ncbi:CotS family spore coat protein [Clostridium sp. P21]|uniref:CotS family spore coat protein n=1 Tax=Clostridium muellerianum TaxID=2716538 RepID=A0A7Y0EFY5_9CLOT|nr:CotS family spore coat protein [Clostridium muellerianum]NMM62692.1 CotS family spore coat protein [Clostridium muellerianum]